MLVLVVGAVKMGRLPTVQSMWERNIYPSVDNRHLLLIRMYPQNSRVGVYTQHCFRVDRYDIETCVGCPPRTKRVIVREGPPGKTQKPAHGPVSLLAPQRPHLSVIGDRRSDHVIRRWLVASLIKGCTSC